MNEGTKEGLAMNSVFVGTMFSSKHPRSAGYRRLHCPYSTTNGESYESTKYEGKETPKGALS
jgi:hypothetical protein